MVFAARDEPLVVVSTKGVFKWTLKRSPELKAACRAAVGDTNIPNIASLAQADANRVVTDAIRRSRSHPAPAACGARKVHLVSCHNLGSTIFA